MLKRLRRGPFVTASSHAEVRHSDPCITLGIYGHVVPQLQRDAAERLAARIESELLTDAGIADSAARRCLVSVSLVGAVGIEPTTFGLKGRCSTTELRPYMSVDS